MSDKTITREMLATCREVNSFLWGRACELTPTSHWYIHNVTLEQDSVYIEYYFKSDLELAETESLPIEAFIASNYVELIQAHRAELARKAQEALEAQRAAASKRQEESDRALFRKLKDRFEPG